MIDSECGAIVGATASEEEHEISICFNAEATLGDFDHRVRRLCWQEITEEKHTTPTKKVARGRGCRVRRPVVEAKL
jgi:hypothetical protein